MANFGHFHSKSFQAQVQIITGFLASTTILEKVLDKKDKPWRFFFVIKFLEK